MTVDNWRLRLQFVSIHHDGRAFGNSYNPSMPSRSYEHAQARRGYAKFQSNYCVGQPLARLQGYPLSSKEIYKVWMRNQQVPPWARDYTSYECGHRGHVKSSCSHLIFSGYNQVEYRRREVPRWE
ncbi:hypothetical protein L873DRAFT_1788193 [Choiromyces venosus 120613-1]|uniref:Uncharacterized protein n=1 Tax=Choiromyces venosus 120613-1 TaxID=1336337 RepID=A0A3N4JT40_9PEZI|nr:hypothetical protein L873DRAFT_1788193 [Choiromyces venosus 120613-1]